MTHFSLFELESFDPDASPSKGERRFWCPLCGEGKPKDGAHRSLCLNVTSGLWNCKRCGAKGKLREQWEAPKNSREIAVQKLRRAFEIAPAPVAKVRENATDWRLIWESAQPVDFSPGAAYLENRGISLHTAGLGCVSFVASWHGRAALCFPFHNLRREVVAIAGRCLENGGMDKPAAGPKSEGAYFVHTDALAAFTFGDLPQVIVCEAPLDALSLGEAGFAAMALGGTAFPEWLAPKLAFCRVALAFDADEAGDGAARKIAPLLASFGARCLRLRPEGAKDWNQFLVEQGREELGFWLRKQLSEKSG